MQQNANHYTAITYSEITVEKIVKISFYWNPYIAIGQMLKLSLTTANCKLNLLFLHINMLK